MAGEVRSRRRREEGEAGGGAGGGGGGGGGRACHYFTILIFNKFSGKFLFKNFRFLVPRQKRYCFNINQPRSHFEKFAGNIKILFLHLPNIIKILIYKLNYRNIVNI